MNKYRTHTCSALTDRDIDNDVILLGGYIEREIMEICCLSI